MSGAGRRGRRGADADAGEGGSPALMITLIVLAVVVLAAVGIGLFIGLSKKKPVAAPAAAAAAPAAVEPANQTPPETKKPETTTHTEGGSGWKTANATFFESYPRCCKGGPAYDPNAPKDECEDYSGCKYQGLFAGADNKVGLEEVKSRNIVAYYDHANMENCLENCPWWDKNAKGRKIQVRDPSSGNTMIVEALDRCGNDDCDSCCSKNSKKGGGTVIDFEINTAKRFYNGNVKDEHNIEWKWV